ncbi:MAG: flagellar hook-length control protein FliK [Pseudomonadota bacterium]
MSALAVRVPGTAIDVTLDPPELGRIEIMLDFAENGLRASLSAERQATGDLLRRHSEILSEHFENAGFSDVDLSFSNSSESGSDLFGSGTRTDDARQQSDQRPGSNAAESRRVQTSAGSAGMDILL